MPLSPATGARVHAIVLAGLAMDAAIVSPVWTANRAFPLAPAFHLAGRVPAVITATLLAAGAIVLLLSAFRALPRWSVLAAAAAVALAISQDLSRFQPWLYQYLAMCIVLAPALGGDARLREARALNACRLILVAVYFWSGLHKLNEAFVHHVVPFLLGPVAARVPVLAAAEPAIGYVAPWIEIAFAIGLALPRTRRVAAAGAIAMHAGLLALLGPWALDYNPAVWPWNACMAVLVYELMWRADTPLSAVLWNAGWRPHLVAAVLFGLCPVLNFVGAWDDYPAFSLYAGNVTFGDVIVSGSVRDRLPAEAAAFLRPLSDGRSQLPLDAWARRSLRVPVYPAERVHRTIAASFCRGVVEDGDLELVEHRSAGWFYRPGFVTVVRTAALCPAEAAAMQASVKVRR